MCKKLIIFCLTLAATATVASAEVIHYVDATHGPSGNTMVRSPDTPGSNTWVVWDLPGLGAGLTTAYGGSDNLWRLRSYGLPTSNPTVYESGGSYGTTENPEDCPRLKTTVSGLPEDTYKVYVFFWSDTSQWRIRAGLSCSPLHLPLYASRLDRDPGEELPPLGDPPAELCRLRGQGGFDFPPVPPGDVWWKDGNRELWYAYLGEVTGTEIVVCVDDDPAHMTHNYRTWYEGIGYIPEPTTVVLLGLGGLALLRKRRS